MFTEAGRVVAVEPDSLWVEVIQTSACEACTARKGCGQSAINKVFSARRQHVRALLPDGGSSGSYRVGDWVELQVPDSTILQGVALVYLLPLLAMIAAALLGQSLFPQSEGRVILATLAGLGLGVLAVRGLAARFGRATSLCPRVSGRLAAPVAAAAPAVPPA